MESRVAAIRVDASPVMGIGHVMRCLTLADALRDEGYRCRFFSTVETINLVPALTASGHPLTPLWPVQAFDPEAVTQALPGGADVVVVDHYGLDARYERGLRPAVRLIIGLDDLADRQRDCDLLVDQTLGRGADDYRFLVPGHCQVLAGTSYALLRPQFAPARATMAARRSGRSARRVLVSLGGTDSLNVTEWVLGIIAETGLPLAVDVLLGAGAPHLDRVRARIEHMSGVGLWVGTEDVAELMLKADLAVGAAGTSSWERCCVGLPSLLLVTADNQRLVAQSLVEAGAAQLVGQMPGADPAVLKAALVRLAGEPGVLARMSMAAAAVCDGQGTARVVGAVARELAKR